LREAKKSTSTPSIEGLEKPLDPSLHSHLDDGIVLTNGQVEAAEENDDLFVVYVEHEKVRIVESCMGASFPSITIQGNVCCVREPQQVGNHPRLPIFRPGARHGAGFSPFVPIVVFFSALY
jgi:hypothetical protein